MKRTSLQKTLGFIQLFFLFAITLNARLAYSQKKEAVVTFHQYIAENVPDKKEIDVFLSDLSWARFDPEVGYILGNYMPHDGLDMSSTISTVQSNRARKSFMYTNKPCRINTYGNSFTQCHQVSDGETWQEYLAAHLGEPVRNYGMGGYGVYQSFRRLLQEEKTSNAAEYLVFYMWGDDHFRSLLRCRYMTFKGWTRTQEEREGVGKMFHGNFWPNVEMDLEKGEFVERNSLIKSREELYNMADPEWTVENLKDDLALQMALFKKGEISDIDSRKLEKLAASLNFPLDLDTVKDLRETVGELLDKYALASSKYILKKLREFAAKNNKKLLVVVFDPYRVTTSLIREGTRYDQEIIDYLEASKFNYFDMNLVHAKDYRNFNLDLKDYFKRYFIGHYSPAGNHFFAYSIKPTIVEWLRPIPITYRTDQQKEIDFKGYLEGN